MCYSGKSWVSSHQSPQQHSVCAVSQNCFRRYPATEHSLLLSAFHPMQSYTWEIFMDADQTVVHQCNYTEYAELTKKLWKWISRLFTGLPDTLLSAVNTRQMWPQCTAKQRLSNHYRLWAVWPLTSVVTLQNYVASKCKTTDGYVHSFSATSLTLSAYGGYGMYKQLLQQVITLIASQCECPHCQATSLMEERWGCLKGHHIHHPQDFSLWPQSRPLSNFNDCNTETGSIFLRNISPI
jgi:hypothetical protein